MKIVNRGYILVKPTQAFVDWSNKAGDDIEIALEFTEGSIYLIEEDFMETEPILKANFKKIFANEFDAVTDDEEAWPCELKLENFATYFSVEFGSMVFDTLSSNIRVD